ncbi:hypothetical protein V0288_09125 [Pannus brasiliensis CCIBt3594]|uniref:Uncharacterized protein n=1 Tax=Pannus brasiliensis CCIBt3594 TaxID=1427578 RepID=A0AAW9QWY9_9CHRO
MAGNLVSLVLSRPVRGKCCFPYRDGTSRSILPRSGNLERSAFPVGNRLDFPIDWRGGDFDFRVRRLKNTYLCLKSKKDEYVEREKDIWLTLKDLELEPGMSLYLQGVKITNTKGFVPRNLVEKGNRKYRGWTAEEG